MWGISEQFLTNENKISVDVRIIAATHRPLGDQVRKHKFREDLFYRLNARQIHLPPLREREGDVRYLLDYFLQKFSRALNKPIIGFASKAMQALLDFQYPGNVRELSNIVEYAVNVCTRKKINAEHLPPYIFDQQGIEEVHFNFLVWKKVAVLDAVIGNWRTAVEKGVAGTLLQGEILISNKDESLTL